MERSARILVCLLGLGTPMLSPMPAHAEPHDSTARSSARELGYEGVKAYEAGDYELASKRLEKAYELVKAPSLALWSARALEKRGKLVQASERYLEATRLRIEDTSELAVQEKAKTDAKAEHERLAPQIPRLEVVLHGASAQEVELTLDGEPLPSAVIETSFPVDPGEHEIVARRGSERAKVRVSLSPGGVGQAELHFDARAAGHDHSGPKKPGPNLTAPIVVLSAGAVMTIAGIVLLATSSECDYYGYCIEDSGAMTAGAVLTPIGVAGMIGGGVWMGLKISHHKKAAATAVLTPIPLRAGAGLGVVGTF